MHVWAQPATSVAVATAAASRGTTATHTSVLSLLAVLTRLSPTIAGGLLSGGLHAITGPDHLAAILPPSVGRPGWHGLRVGATWGLGHGISAVFLGVCAFFLKGRMSEQFRFLQRISTLAESAVGVSLVAIGVIGIKDNLQGENTDGHGDGTDSEPPTASLKTSKAIFANGILHGFSWDGAPSLAPALAMTSWRSAVAFLLAYCFGTMAAMSITAGVVGEGSIRLGKVINSPQLPRQLSLGSSFIAIAIGLFWIYSALI